MVVGFDLESGAPAVADVDDSGVFARWNDDALARRGQPPQMDARRFIRAVLRPHDGEDAKLDEGRLAPQKLYDACEFFTGKIMRGDLFGSDHKSGDNPDW